MSGTARRGNSNHEEYRRRCFGHIGTLSRVSRGVVDSLKCFHAYHFNRCFSSVALWR